MPERTDFLALMQRMEQAKDQRMLRERDIVLPQIAEIAHKAQTVLDHPGWQMYADKLETRIHEIQTKRDATAQRMVTGPDMGHDLELLKINLNAMDAEIAGLRYAQSLIPQAIELGRDIGAAAGHRADA